MHNATRPQGIPEQNPNLAPQFTANPNAQTDYYSSHPSVSQPQPAQHNPNAMQQSTGQYTNAANVHTGTHQYLQQMPVGANGDTNQALQGPIQGFSGQSPIAHGGSNQTHQPTAGYIQQGNEQFPVSKQVYSRQPITHHQNANQTAPASFAQTPTTHNGSVYAGNSSSPQANQSFLGQQAVANSANIQARGLGDQAQPPQAIVYHQGNNVPLQPAHQANNLTYARTVPASSSQTSTTYGHSGTVYAGNSSSNQLLPGQQTMTSSVNDQATGLVNQVQPPQAIVNHQQGNNVPQQPGAQANKLTYYAQAVPASSNQTPTIYAGAGHALAGNSVPPQTSQYTPGQQPATSSQVTDLVNQAQPPIAHHQQGNSVLQQPGAQANNFAQTVPASSAQTPTNYAGTRNAGNSVSPQTSQYTPGQQAVTSSQATGLVNQAQSPIAHRQQGNNVLQQPRAQANN